MSSLGPVVIVAQNGAPELVDALARAGAGPIVETKLAAAAAAVVDRRAIALILADAQASARGTVMSRLIQSLESLRGPFTPVLARLGEEDIPDIPFLVPVRFNESTSRLVARLHWAAGIRTLHSSLLARSPNGRGNKRGALRPDPDAPITLLCIGRDGFYRDISAALGDDAAVVRALAIDTAVQHLGLREIHAAAIDARLGHSVVTSFLGSLEESSGLRSLPVAVFGACNIENAELPNLIQIEEAAAGARFLLPLARLQILHGQIERMLRSIASDGAFDPQSGLAASDTFWNALDESVSDAEVTGAALSVARFSFGDIDRRASLDAARTLSRLLRNCDFASQDSDGSILTAFTGTDLQTAHVIARRLAAALKRLMLPPPPGQDHGMRPTITLATLKSTDDARTLAARVGAASKLARGAG